MLAGAIFTFSLQELWFLRPQWLWGFVPIASIGLMFLLSYRRKEEWKKSISRLLLPYISIPGTRQQFLWPRVGIILLLSLMTLALAGPTWEEQEQSGDRSEAALVLLLDLSRSMRAEDIQPNRLDRARLKIKDLFASQPGIRTALVAYAATAHTVVPFTKDYRVLEQQMDALRPDIMPMQGTNLQEALALADSLLLRVEAPSTILLVTDGIRKEDVPFIRETSGNSRLEIMILGTPGGAVIPEGKGVLTDSSGEPVVAGFDPSVLTELGALPGVHIVTVTLDESDVRILAMHIRQHLEFVSDPELAEAQWKDAGYWLLVPLVLISFLWFRKGWMVHWSWLLIALMLLPACSENGDYSLADLFRSKDQQGKNLLQKQEVEAAAERFESAQWKGYAWAEAGELEKAMKAYSRETNAPGFYNLGVIYARMGDAEAARAAFSAALELDPDLKLAEENLKRVNFVLDSMGIASSEAEEDADNLPQEFTDPGKISENQEQAQESDQTYKGKGDITEMGNKEVDETTIDFFETGGEPSPIDQQGARQARTGGHRDGIHITQRHIGLRQCLFDTKVQFFGMGPGRDLWHDPAKGCVQIGLSGHH